MVNVLMDNALAPNTGGREQQVAAKNAQRRIRATIRTRSLTVNWNPNAVLRLRAFAEAVRRQLHTRTVQAQSAPQTSSAVRQHS